MSDSSLEFPGLPAVAGRRLLTSIAEHVRQCLVLIDEEQRKPNPNNVVIMALCESVRFAREHTDYVRDYFKASDAKIDDRPEEDPWTITTDSNDREELAAALAIGKEMQPLYEHIKSKLPPRTMFAVIVEIPAVDESGARIMALSTNRRHCAGLAAQWSLDVLGRSS